MHSSRSSRTTDPASVELAEGGFAPDTEVMATRGPTPVTDLGVGDQVYTLDPSSRLVKLKPVTGVKTVSVESELIAIESRRADLHVAPDHRILYRTTARPRPRFLAAREFLNRSDHKFVNAWRRPPAPRLETVDITNFVDHYEICAAHDCHGHTFRAKLPDGCDPHRRNSHAGYYFSPETFKHYQDAIEGAATETRIHAGRWRTRRPYRFAGDDFLRFIGWYATEGSVTQNSGSDTEEIKLAQKHKQNRVAIAALLDRMGLEVTEDERGFRFSSKLYGHLLKDLCGTESRSKQLPAFVWSLPQDQQQLLLDVLIAGDGNDSETFYTSSDRLAGDVLRLSLELGMKPRYLRYRDMWQIYIRDVSDGFTSWRNVSRVSGGDELYRLTVEDYSTVMAGRNGRFQWVGVSCVS